VFLVSCIHVSHLWFDQVEALETKAKGFVASLTAAAQSKQTLLEDHLAREQFKEKVSAGVLLCALLPASAATGVLSWLSYPLLVHFY
jgi:hypothetical protein